jgi:hypothetical protein
MCIGWERLAPLGNKIQFIRYSHGFVDIKYLFNKLVIITLTHDPHSIMHNSSNARVKLFRKEGEE